MHGNPVGIGRKALLLGAGIDGIGPPAGDLPPNFASLSISVGLAHVVSGVVIAVQG